MGCPHLKKPIKILNYPKTWNLKLTWQGHLKLTYNLQSLTILKLKISNKPGTWNFDRIPLRPLRTTFGRRRDWWRSCLDRRRRHWVWRWHDWAWSWRRCRTTSSTRRAKIRSEVEPYWLDWNNRRPDNEFLTLRLWLWKGTNKFYVSLEHKT